MHIAQFALERFFARHHESSIRYSLCASDIEPHQLSELLALGDDETREMWNNLHLGYTETPGLAALRAEVASLYESATPDDVLIFTGGQEPLFIAMHALLEPGDHIVLVSPAYQALHEVPRSIGADITFVPLDPTRGWALDPTALRRALRSKTRVVAVNFPHNPTGAQPEPEVFAAVVEACSDAGAHLFSDEVFRWMEHDGVARLPAGVDVSPRGISLGVLSKPFGLGGLRIGWLATRDAALRQRLASLKDYTTVCNSAPSEVLALMGLRARDRILARTREIIAANLPLVDAFFERHRARFEWVRPRAGVVAYPHLLDGDVDEFAKTLLEREGVLILPASGFGDSGNYFRIGFGRRGLPAALERLESFIGY